MDCGRVGERNRRQKLRSLTEEGRALAQALFEDLRPNLANAYWGSKRIGRYGC